MNCWGGWVLRFDANAVLKLLSYKDYILKTVNDPYRTWKVELICKNWEPHNNNDKSALLLNTIRLHKYLPSTVSCMPMKPGV